MPFITFIYKIKNTEKIFHGKYVCDDVSSNYEGLDIGIKPIVITPTRKKNETKYHYKNIFN